MLVPLVVCALTFLAILPATPASAGDFDCGISADSLLAVPGTDTLSKFYPFRPGVPGQDLIWRDLEFMWDSLYTTPGFGHTATDRDRMRLFAENLVNVRGKNPFTPGPGSSLSDFQLAYDFFRASGENYTQAPGDSESVVLGNFDRFSQPLTSYNSSDRSHLDVYLVRPNHLDPSPNNRFLATCPSEFIEKSEDLTSGRVNDPKPANSIQVIMGGINPTTDTLWTSHDHIWARTVVHEMQHGLPSTDRAGLYSEMFSQGTEVVVGMTTAASAEANNGEVPFSWNIFDYQDGSITCEQVTERAGLNYELRSLFTAYLAFNLQGSDATLEDDLLRRWARSDRTESSLRRLLRNDSCVTCSTTSYFPAGPGGAALDDTTRMALLNHYFRVAIYANDTTLAQGQYGYPPRFRFKPAEHYRIWQSFDDCEENDIVAVPPEIVVDESLLSADTVLVGSRMFRGNTAALRFRNFGAEYWILRNASGLLGTNRTLRVRISAEEVCPLGRLTASWIGYAPPDDSVAVATGRLWAHPEWATYASAPTWVVCDSIRQPLEIDIPDFGATYKVAVLVITPGDAALDYRMAVTLADHLIEPQVPAPLATTTDGSDSAPSWDPTGEEIAVVRIPTGGVNQIYRQKVDGSTATPLTAASPQQTYPDWSPRGDKVVFSQHASASIPDNDLYLHDVKSGTTQVFLASASHDLQPAFSPNGQQVAFYQLRTSPPLTWSLVRIDLDGSNLTTLCQLPDNNTLRTPEWSPDGERIYFSRRDTLWAVPLAGGTPVAIHPESFLVRDFDVPLGTGPLILKTPWSYERCLTSSFNGFGLALGDTSLFVNGGRIRRFNFDPFAPRWSPEGTRVSFVENLGGSSRRIWLTQMTGNHAPAMSVSDSTVGKGVPLTINLSATDADGDPIAYQAPARYLPAGATFNGSQFSWGNPTPEGAVHYVVFRALDPFGGVANQVVRLEVVEGNSGGGGGCPFVDTKTAQGWEVENSILGRSLTGAFELDPYRLARAPEIVDGKVRIRIREDEQEVTTLDGVQLVAFDHPIGSQVFRLGERTVTAALSRAHRVTDSRGTDLTWRFLEGAYQGHPGDTLFVDMTDPNLLRAQAGAEGVGPRATTNDEGEGGYMNGFQKPLDPEGVRHQLDNESVAAPADVQVLNETGILVEAPDGRGGWRLVKRYYPREHEAECTLDSLGRGSLRLIFVGRHALNYIGRLTDVTTAPESQTLTMTTANHSRLGSVASALGVGGTTTSLSPGDTLNLEFVASAVPEGKVRSYFLLSTGVYTDASNARAPLIAQEQALPTTFALAQNKPNPFAQTTTISFALPVVADVKLEIFDLQGRLVRVLANRTYEPGYHAVEWDRSDQAGSSVAAGVYLYRLGAGSFVEQRKMVLLAR